MREKFDVTGMTCSACVAHVEKSVSKVEGVTQVQVNLLQNSMVVDFDETKKASMAPKKPVYIRKRRKKRPMWPRRRWKKSAIGLAGRWCFWCPYFIFPWGT